MMNPNEIYRLNDGRFFHFRFWETDPKFAVGAFATKATQRLLEKKFRAKGLLNGNADGQLQFDAGGENAEDLQDIEPTGWSLAWLSVFVLVEDSEVHSAFVQEHKVTEGSIRETFVRIDGDEYPLAKPGAALKGEVAYLDWDEACQAADELGAQLQAFQNN